MGRRLILQQVTDSDIIAIWAIGYENRTSGPNCDSGCKLKYPLVGLTTFWSASSEHQLSDLGILHRVSSLVPPKIHARTF